jgi:glycosyltransferase involved in cell wall biosynthesis
VVAEALACALPVIVSDKVNIWREIADCSAGLVEKDTIEGTNKSLARWSGMTPQQRAEFSANARQCFHQRFDYLQTSKIVLENLEQLARSTPRYKAVDTMTANTN